jgi:monoamine oxidase
MTGMSNAGYSNTSGCSSLHELSLKRTVEYERHWKDHDGCCNDDGGDCRLSPPLAMSDVIDHVAADVDVRKNCRTNTKVLKVDYAEDTINIETSSEPGRLVQTKKVVVTVPVRIMIDGDIEFNPPLPAEKIEALSLYGMEDALKLFLVFRTRVWPEKVQNCIIADAPIPEMWFRSTPATSDAPSVHICCCFATAKFADSLKALKEPDATTAALKLLADMFDRTIDLNRQEVRSC